MSRPGSRAGSGKKGKKEKPKPPKKVIAELTEQNEQLTTELTQLKQEAEQMRTKIELVTKKIVAGTNKKDLAKLYKIDDNSDLMALTPDIILDMVGKLVVKKTIQEKSVESRVEELETRVTEMSMALAKMTTKTMAYENGILKISKCDNMEDIKDKLCQLTLIAGEEYHTFTTNDPVHTAKHFPDILESSGVHDRNSATQKSLLNAQQLNLVPPKKKLPGETHLTLMHKDLKLFIMKELSIEKPSGADWRMLAERVGVEQDHIRYWNSMKLQCPMGKVLNVWSESEAATVRMLHRHLVSPQMRCTLLAKRIADFYSVEYS